MSNLTTRTVVLELAQRLNISKASEALGVTQSALSQRLQKTEQSLGHAIFTRGARGLSLTTFGSRLQRFYKNQEAQEKEFFGKTNSRGGLSGKLVIGAYPSVARSLVLRSLAPLLRANPQIEFELQIRQSHELPSLVESGDIDLALIDIPHTQAGLEISTIGNEVYVEIESSKYRSPENIYLDLDHRDPATWTFLKNQKRLPKNFARLFMSDVYAIINGVEEGLGRAVMPKHLLERSHQIRVRKPSGSIPFPIHMVCPSQPIHLELHRAAMEQLKQGAKKFL